MMALDQTIEVDDATLLARMAAGDRVAARVLTTRLAPRVHAHAFRLLGNIA